MTNTNQSWQFDPDARTVTDSAGTDIVCIVPPRQPLAVGQLLASTPMLAAIAKDLRAQLSDSLSAWEGEEDSVQEEHAELITSLQAASEPMKSWAHPARRSPLTRCAAWQRPCWRAHTSSTAACPTS